MELWIVTKCIHFGILIPFTWLLYQDFYYDSQKYKQSLYQHTQLFNKDSLVRTQQKLNGTRICVENNSKKILVCAKAIYMLNAILMFISREQKCYVFLIVSYVFSSTKLEKTQNRFCLGWEGRGRCGGRGEK
jgi:hypothetical protein